MSRPDEDCPKLDEVRPVTDDVAARTPPYGIFMSYKFQCQYSGPSVHLHSQRTLSCRAIVLQDYNSLASLLLEVDVLAEAAVELALEVGERCQQVLAQGTSTRRGARCRHGGAEGGDARADAGSGSAARARSACAE